MREKVGDFYMFIIHLLIHPHIYNNSSNMNHLVKKIMIKYQKLNLNRNFKKVKNTAIHLIVTF